MILLHLILSNTAHLPTSIPTFPSSFEDELITDVEKSLDIFTSMNNVIVARRCAEMIREVLDVARVCIDKRRRRQQQEESLSTHMPMPIPPAHQGLPPAAASSNDNQAPHQSQNVPAPPPPSSPVNFAREDNMDIEAGGGGDFFSALFGGLDSEATAAAAAAAGDDGTRAGVLADLVDPGVLVDFAFGEGEGSGFYY